LDVYLDQKDVISANIKTVGNDGLMIHLIFIVLRNNKAIIHAISLFKINKVQAFLLLKLYKLKIKGIIHYINALVFI
jgi:hypothetical protein